VIDDPAILRSEILKYSSQRFQKVAMVVGRVMMSPGVEFSKDQAIADVIVEMVAKGDLVSVGDLSNMRFSEVKLP